MKSIVIYADGGSRGNPGPSGAGAVVLEGKKVLVEVSLFLGTATNNIAEYTAILEGLRAAKKKIGTTALKSTHVEVRMDSELVIRQLSGMYKVKHPNLKPLFAQVQAEVENHFPHIRYTHVPREKNTLADALANKAMDTGH